MPSERIIDDAIELALKINITFYDAYFIALSKELNFLFITADKKLYEKTKRMPFVRFLKNLWFVINTLH